MRRWTFESSRLSHSYYDVKKTILRVENFHFRTISEQQFTTLELIKSNWFTHSQRAIGMLWRKWADEECFQMCREKFSMFSQYFIVEIDFFLFLISKKLENSTWWLQLCCKVQRNHHHQVIIKMFVVTVLLMLNNTKVWEKRQFSWNKTSKEFIDLVDCSLWSIYCPIFCYFVSMILSLDFLDHQRFLQFV